MGQENSSPPKPQPTSPPPPEPWRKVEIPFDQANDKIISKIKNIKESTISIILMGHTGAGKSSFINTVRSMILGRISSIAHTKGDTLGGLGTLEFLFYRMAENLMFYDTTGFAVLGTVGSQNDYLEALFEGKVKLKERYDAERVAKADEKNKPHCAIFVISAEAVSLNGDILDKYKKLHNMIPRGSQKSRAIADKQIKELRPDGSTRRPQENIFKYLKKYLEEHPSKINHKTEEKGAQKNTECVSGDDAIIIVIAVMSTRIEDDASIVMQKVKVEDRSKTIVVILHRVSAVKRVQDVQYITYKQEEAKDTPNKGFKVLDEKWCERLEGYRIKDVITDERSPVCDWFKNNIENKEKAKPKGQTKAASNDDRIIVVNADMSSDVQDSISRAMENVTAEDRSKTTLVILHKDVGSKTVKGEQSVAYNQGMKDIIHVSYGWVVPDERILEKSNCILM